MGARQYRGNREDRAYNTVLQTAETFGLATATGYYVFLIFAGTDPLLLGVLGGGLFTALNRAITRNRRWPLPR